MTKVEPKKICGIVMPISAIDGCNEGHWNEVLKIVTESIGEADFEAHMVSDADDVGIIQKRIIQNLYDNPIVVCDVSAKNPNVMFELGMRLAFDKPTIIIKDDKTAYSFDTASIEHIEYPRDLRFSKIVDFKKKLTEKIIGTFNKSNGDPNYTTFLKHFGAFTVAKIDHKEISGQDFILEELQNIKVSMRNLERSKIMYAPRLNKASNLFMNKEDIAYLIHFEEFNENKISEIIDGIGSGIILSYLITDSLGIRKNFKKLIIRINTTNQLAKLHFCNELESRFEALNFHWERTIED